MRLFSVLIVLSNLIFSQASMAKEKTIYDADYVLEVGNNTIDIDANGNAKMQASERWVPLNEEGKETLAQHKIPYDPEFTKVKFINARTLAPFKMPRPFRLSKSMTFHFGSAGKIERDEDRKASRIQPSKVKVVGAELTQKGVTNSKVMIVPFTNLEKRSTAELKYEYTTKPRFPGQYTQTFAYGMSFPEIEGTTTIRSKKPLYFSVTDPKKHLNVTLKQEKGLYVLTIEIDKAAYFPASDEPQAYIAPDTYPRVDVSTFASWQDVTAPLMAGFEREINQPIPPEFRDIVTAAQKRSTPTEQMNEAIRLLISKVTYAGDWVTAKGKYYPRGHKVLAASKSGDCKDFSTLATALLRALGYDANVALTYRGEQRLGFGRNIESYKKVASPDYFNHAIVHVTMKDGSERWIDPTNLVVDTETIFTDIQGSPALILSKATNTLAVIPSDSPADSQTTTEIRIRPDGMTEVIGTIKFAKNGAAEVQSMIKKYGPHEGEKILKLITGAGFGAQENVNLTYDRKLDQLDGFETSFNFMQTSSKLTDNQNYVVVPYPFRLFLLKILTPERQTGVYLGSPGSDRSVTTITDKKSLDDVSGDCLIKSKWYDIDRKVRDQKMSLTTSMIITDTVIQHVSRISLEDLKSQDFGEFVYSAASCLGRPIAFLKTATKSATLVQLTDMTLEKATAFLEDYKSDSAYKDLTAMRFIEQVLEKNPDDLEARALYTIGLQHRGYLRDETHQIAYLDASLKELNYVLTKDPKHLRGLRQRSWTYYYKGELPNAVKDFNVARQIDPYGTKTATLGSALALKLGKSQEAESWLLLGLHTAKDATAKKHLRAKLGTFYLNTKQYQKSIDTYKLALQDEPTNAWYHNNISISQRLAGDADGAIASAKRALEISDFGAGRSNLASALCAKAMMSFKNQPITADLIKKNQAQFESTLFEGLSRFPTNYACLNIASEYFEIRTQLFNEAESAKRASEYYSRLYKESQWFTHEMASQQMKQTASQLAKGDTSFIHFPRSDMKMMGVQLKFDLAPKENRMPAATK